MQKPNSENNLLLNTTLVLLLKLVFHLIGDLWENKLFYKWKQNNIYFTAALTWSWEIRVENKTVMFASHVFNKLLIEVYNPYKRDLFNMRSIKLIRRRGGKSCCCFLHSTVLDFRVIKTNQPVWYWVQD